MNAPNIPGAAGPQNAFGLPVQIQEQVTRSLRNEQVPQGWQVGVRLEERVTVILQLCTGSRLAHQPNDGPENLMQHLNQAISFERHGFLNAPSREKYNQYINSRLQNFTGIRKQNVQQMMQNAGNLQPGMQQGRLQPNAQMGLNKQNGMGQPFGQAMQQRGNVQNQPNAQMQQHLFQLQQQAQQQQQAAKLQELKQQQQQQQQRQQAVQTNMQGSNPNLQVTSASAPTSFNPGDQANNVNFQGLNVPNQPQNLQDRINQIARGMIMNLEKTGKLSQIREQYYKRFTQERLQQYRSQGVDPIIELFQQRAKQTLLANVDAQGVNQSPGNMPGMNAQPGQNQISQMGGAPQSVSQRNATLNRDFDPSQVTNLLADGQRSQAAGDLVVPASNNPNMIGAPNTMVPFPGQSSSTTGRMQPNQGINGLTPEQIAQRERVHRATQMNTTNQMANNNIPPKQPNPAMLQGQLGGLHAGQQTTQQSPAMSMLTRPLGQPNGQSKPTNQAQTPSRSKATPQTGSTQPQQSVPQPSNRPQSIGQPANSGITIPPGLVVNDNQKERLKAMPVPEAQGIIAQMLMMQNRQAGQMQQSMHQRQPSAQQKAAPQPPSMTDPNGQGQGVNMPPNAVMQQPQFLNTMRGPSAPPSNPLMQTRDRMIDQILLNKENIQKAYPNLSLPLQIKSWGQFKAWLRQNPSIIPPPQQGPLKSMHDQVANFVMSKIQNEMQQKAASASGNQQSQPQQPTQQSTPQNVAHNPGSFQARVTRLIQNNLVVFVNNQIQIKQVTPQEIQNYRSNHNEYNESNTAIQRRLMTERARKIQVYDAQLWDVIKQSNANLQLQQSQQLQQQGQGQARQMNMGNQKPPQIQQPPGQPAAQARMMGNQQMQQPQNISNTPMQSGMPNTTVGGGALRQPGMPGQPMNPAMNLSQQPGALFGQQPGQHPMMSNANSTLEQRAQLEAQMKMRENQSNQPQMPNANASNQNNDIQVFEKLKQATPPQRAVAFQRIMQEAQRTSSQRTQPVSIGPMQKEQLNQLTRQFSPLVSGTLESLKQMFIHQIALLPPQFVRAVQEALGSLFKLRSVMGPNAQILYNMSPEEYRFIAIRLTKMMEMFAKSKQQLLPQQQASQDQAPTTQQLVPTTTSQAPSSQNNAPAPASSVSQPTTTKSAVAADQATSMERKTSTTSKRKNQGPPAAPTTSNPPSGFGEVSPHGTPKYGEVPTRFRPENMSIPANKRRKQTQSGSTASTPAANQPTPPVTSMSPQATTVKPAAPVVAPAAPKQPQRPSEVLEHSHKCPIPSCDYHIDGFIDKEDKDQHCKEVHNYDGNAISWCLANMKKTLLGDSNAKKTGPLQKSQEQKKIIPDSPIRIGTPLMASSMRAEAMQRSASAISVTKFGMTSEKVDGLISAKRSADSMPDDSPGSKRPKSVPIFDMEDPWAKSRISRESLDEIWKELPPTIHRTALKYGLLEKASATQDISGLIDATTASPPVAPPALTPSGDTPASRASEPQANEKMTDSSFIVDDNIPQTDFVEYDDETMYDPIFLKAYKNLQQARKDGTLANTDDLLMPGKAASSKDFEQTPEFLASLRDPHDTKTVFPSIKAVQQGPDFDAEDEMWNWYDESRAKEYRTGFEINTVNPQDLLQKKH